MNLDGGGENGSQERYAVRHGNPCSRGDQRSVKRPHANCARARVAYENVAEATEAGTGVASVSTAKSKASG